MKKGFSLQKFNMRKHYIMTKPKKVSDISEIAETNLITTSDYRWLEKSRRLQARRWRRIKHQIA